MGTGERYSDMPNGIDARITSPRNSCRKIILRANRVFGTHALLPNHTGTDLDFEDAMSRDRYPKPFRQDV